MMSVDNSRTTKRRRKAGNVLASLLLATTALGVSAAFSTPASAQEMRRYDIPAGALPDVLNAYARQAGVELAYRAELTAAASSAGLKGSYGVAEALSRILAGSGITYRQTGPRAFTLEAAPAADAGIVQLGAVRVEGDDGGIGTGSSIADQHAREVTEGTKSYTVRTTNGSTGLPLSLRQTPQSIAVMTHQRLEDQRPQTLADVMANAPGITVSQLDSERTIFSARGFAIEQLQYDGISTPYDVAFTDGESEISPVIYDRIEIVRGATGLLSGPGWPSASINLIRKHADSRALAGEAYVSGGSWSNFQGVLDVTAPLDNAGAIRARTVLALQDKDFFIDNYHRLAKVGYGVIDADLSASTTLSVGVSYQDNESDAVTYGGQPTLFSDGTPTRFRRSFSVAPKWAYENTGALNAFAELQHQFGNDWLLKATLMHGRYKVDNARLFIYGLPDPDTGVVAGDYGGTRIKLPGQRTQNSGDLRLSGPFDLFGRRHHVIFGFSLYRQKSYYDRIAAIPEWEDMSIYDMADSPEPSWTDPVQSFSGRVTQTASFATVRFSLADPLTAIVGGRYTRVHRSGSWYAGTTPFDSVRRRFVPYAGFVYDFGKQVSAYVSYTSIFNPQDYLNRNRDYLEPVTGDTYEAGVKAEFADGRLNMALTVFNTRQKNLGTYDTDLPDPSTGDFFSAYKPVDSVSKGVELDVNGEPLPGWRLFFNFAHFRLKGENGQVVSPQNPRTSVNIFTTYDLGPLTIGGGVRWQSRIFYTGLYNPVSDDYDGRVSQSAYPVASLLARYAIADRWSAQLNINNLFDRKYETAINYYGQRVWGTPRNVTVTLKRGF